MRAGQGSGRRKSSTVAVATQPNKSPSGGPAIEPKVPVSATAIGEQLARWLRNNQDEEGRILDPLHAQHGSYADGMAALTFALMQQRFPSEGWDKALSRSLTVALRRPADSEFDQMALLLLRSQTGRALQVSVHNGRNLVSNNWVAMRALNFSLRAGLTGSSEDRVIAGELWMRVLGWQNRDGLFVDSPRGNATPLTYHAKFCAVLALALELTECEMAAQLSKALSRGLEALVPFISPGGAMVPYGRSRHSLFGYAAAILALSLGSRLLSRDWREPVQMMLTRLQSFARSDGHIPCVLTDGEERKRDWDVYVNNPDYNAYAAALLLLSPMLGEAAATSCSPAGLTEAGPIVAWRRPDWFVALSGTGASAPFGTPFFCDHRYYGMQPLWVEHQGQVVFEGPVYRWGERESLVAPQRTPWVPYLETKRGDYCCRVYSELEARADGENLVVKGKGSLERYQSVPRWRRGLAGLAGAARMYTAESLQDAAVERSLVWTPGQLSSSSLWSGTWPDRAKARAESESWSFRDNLSAQNEKQG
jgi:hypothetical protein